MMNDSLGQGGRRAFFRAPILIGWAAMLVFTFYACTRMVAAGDTWVAMACGRHFVNHGVNTVEPFSVNSHKAGPTAEEVKTWPGWARWITDKVGLKTVQRWHPTGWINQNWLTHVIFYKLTTALGSETDPYYDALVLWKFGIYLLAAVALYSTARLYGVNWVLSAISVCAAMVIGRTFLDIRPAGFSNLLVAVLILILALASYRNVLYIWVLVPLVIFWSNVHGGYIYAFIVLVPYVGWHAIMRLPRRWSIAAYGILTWLVLCAMSNRVTHHDYLTPVALSHDVLLYLTLLVSAGSIALCSRRQITDGAAATYHVVASCILFLLFLSRFLFLFGLPAAVDRLRPDQVSDLETFIAQSRLSFIGLFLFAAVLGAVVLALKDKMVRRLEVRGILHVVAAGAVAFVAMVLFNPFHLTNLTHTFVISISKQAERWRDVHEWNRAFDWTNPVGTAVPLLVLYILGWLVLIAWVVLAIYVSRAEDRPVRKRAKPAFVSVWSQIDLGLLIIAAMTVYMAIRSRRFIPIAGYAACPVLALVVQEIIGRLLAVSSFRRQKSPDPSTVGRGIGDITLLGGAAALVVGGVWYLLVKHWLFSPIPGRSDMEQPNLALVFLVTVLGLLAFLAAAWWYATATREGAGKGGAMPRESLLGWTLQTAPILLCISLLGFSVWFGLKFKRVYLDPWPLDAKYNSVFMRMTASYSKPFEACEFMRLNKLRGVMFNYWTEGGFIAWGQEPDPNTGRIPLQLFMDGRAQAAYDVATFDLWSDILSGGPVPMLAVRAGRRLEGKDYVQVGDWVTERLRRHGVWVVLMPDGQFGTAFTRSLEYSPDWRTVYTDDKQMMFVDIRSSQGAALYQGIFTGQTRYPNEYLKNMALGHNLLMYADAEQRRSGLEHLTQAVNELPSPAPMREIVYVAAQSSELRPQIEKICQDYVGTFEQNKAAYARLDGYSFRMNAAWLALDYLDRMAEAAKDTKSDEIYRTRIEQYRQELDGIAGQKKW